MALGKFGWGGREEGFLGKIAKAKRSSYIPKRHRSGPRSPPGSSSVVGGEREGSSISRALRPPPRSSRPVGNHLKIQREADVVLSSRTVGLAGGSPSPGRQRETGVVGLWSSLGTSTSSDLLPGQQRARRLAHARVQWPLERVWIRVGDVHSEAPLPKPQQG